MDLSFLAAYAIGMFFAGHLGDRTDLRLFLTVGMLGSGIFVSLFGMVSENGSCLNDRQRQAAWCSSWGCHLHATIQADLECYVASACNWHTDVFVIVRSLPDHEYLLIMQAYFWDIHSLSYFVIVSVGIVVAVMSHRQRQQCLLGKMGCCQLASMCHLQCHLH